MTNIITLSDHRPKQPDPWQHAQPTYHEQGDRFELWSAPYFGVSQLIYANGSPAAPEPPSPSGGSPVAANLREYTKLRVAA